MKKITYLLLMAMAVVLVGQSLASCSSCSDKKEQQKEETDPAKVFTKKDTTRVLELANSFVFYLKEGNMRSAMEMLHFLQGNSIQEVDQTNKQRQALALSLFVKRFDYTIDRIVFRDNVDNEVKIDITLFEKKDEGDKRPNTTSFYLRPVRNRDTGEWFLTTKDNITDTRSDLRNRARREAAEAAKEAKESEE